MVINHKSLMNVGIDFTYRCNRMARETMQPAKLSTRPSEKPLSSAGVLPELLSARPLYSVQMQNVRRIQFFFVSTDFHFSIKKV